MVRGGGSGKAKIENGKEAEGDNQILFGYPWILGILNLSYESIKTAILKIPWFPTSYYEICKIIDLIKAAEVKIVGTGGYQNSLLYTRSTTI